MVALKNKPRRTLTRTVRLHRVQHAFRRSTSLYRGFVGGRGSGKSWVGAYDLIRRARPGRLYMVASPTYTVLSDTTFRTFRNIARDLGVLGDAKVSPPSVKLSTGAEVIFRSADDPEKLRGPNLSGVWLDEASLMVRDAYDICIASLREGGEQGWLSATFTPKGLSHWTYETFASGRPDTEIFHAATRDNPFVPAGFHDTLAKQYTGLLAQQELDGRFVNVAGAEWPPEYFDRHVWADHWPERFSATALALDPSQGRGEKERGCYASFAFAGIDAGGVIWVDAWMGRDWDATALVRQGFELCGRLQPGAFSIETNGGQAFLAELFLAEARARRVVLPLYGIHNSEDKEVRIRTLGPLLAQRQLRFRADSPGCKMLVTQLQEFPAGEYRDGPDALEMALRMLTYLVSGRAANATGQPRLLRA